MTAHPDQPPVTELVVTLTRGARSRTLTGRELDDFFGGPVSIRLTAALLACALPSTVTDPSGRKGVRGLVGQRRSNVNERNVTVSNNCVRFDGVHGVPVGSETAPAAAQSQRSDEAERLASYLVDRLADPKSRRFYERVAREVPREVVQRALVEALDVAPAAIRRSRAALFTSLVMPHLAPRRPPASLPYVPHPRPS